MVLAADFGPALKVAAVQFVTLLLLTAIILDGGRLHRIMLIISLAFCAGVTLIAIRRGQTLTRDDAFFLRWSPVPLLGMGMAIDGVVH